MTASAGRTRSRNDADELYIADNKVYDGTIICAQCYKLIYRDGDTDFTLNNDGTVEELYGQIDNILNKINNNS